MFRLRNILLAAGVAWAVVASIAACALRSLAPDLDLLNLTGAIFLLGALNGFLLWALARSLGPSTEKVTVLRHIAIYLAFMVGLIVIYGFIYEQVGLRDGTLEKPAIVRDLWSCLYFSTVTWTTLGYGDLTAVHGFSRLFAAIEALNGSILTAVFISFLVPSIQKLVSDKAASDGAKHS